MSTTKYPGINYAGRNSNVNRDEKTGIRYGVIPAHDVGAAWYEDSQPVYPDPACPHCGNQLPKDFEEGSKCPHCNKRLREFLDDVEPSGHVYEGNGYKAQQGRDDGDVFITLSPYFTYAQFCSPCAPGACYLPQPLDVEGAEKHFPSDDKYNDNRAYCFGHEWFETGAAPYPVFSVATGERIYTEKK